MEDRNRRAAGFVLTLDELRAITAFNVACAELVIDVFEVAAPDDPRPRVALDAAAAFAAGGPRTGTQRVTALAAHRAAKEVASAPAHAAMSAGDAAASGYLHPLADAAQVGHILRGPAHCVLARMQCTDAPSSEEAMAAVFGLVTATVVDVLRRYPRADVRGKDVSVVVSELDSRLRAVDAQEGAG
ncbi:exonuclease SbcC [Tsukamurella sp. 8F]|uniref:putative immunity protein n=1 Tax=unclassified Tsukamurella TaxID=2633480 RepID=UPI0023B9819C|nr:MULTISPECIES: exonuclease SbcC [unclassified Tsukamurella]MDF0530126.1 exonuclease SbcC [Tsukamurella sp. 8J]MDF0586444.1 exonuclease SbcC [Tsukamurella sp. 8F]